MEQAHTWREDDGGETSPKAKVYVRGFVFAGRDAIQCMVGFWIDSRTIKRGTLKQTLQGFDPFSTTLSFLQHHTFGCNIGFYGKQCYNW
jgi:hypothetical protein